MSGLSSRGKRVLIDIMHRAFATDDDGRMPAVQSLREGSVPLPWEADLRPAKRVAGASSEMTGGGGCVRPESRRPLAELPATFGKEGQCHRQRAQNSSVRLSNPKQDPSKQEGELDRFKNSRGVGAGAEDPIKAQISCSHQPMALLTKSSSACTHPSADYSHTRPSPSYKARPLSSPTPSGPTSTASRATFIHGVLHSSVSPSLEELWWAHSCGIMPLQQVLLKSPDSIHKSLAACIRARSLFAFKSTTPTASSSSAAAAAAAAGTLSNVHPAGALLPILRVLVHMGFPSSCGAPSSSTASVSGARAAEGTETSRLSRKVLAIFNLACCCRPAECGARDQGLRRGTEERWEREKEAEEDGEGRELESVLALLRAVHAALDEQGTGDEGGTGGVMEALACYLLKHLRFSQSPGPVPSGVVGAAEAFESESTADAIAAKSSAFWRELGDIGTEYWQAPGVGATVSEQVVGAFTHLCGLQECLAFVRTRVPSRCGRECALAALFVRKAIAVAVSEMSPDSAIAAQAREVVDGLVRTALQEGDQLSLASCVLLMLFLSSAVPLDHASPFAGTLRQKRSCTQQSAECTEVVEDGEGVFTSCRKWCCYDMWLKLLFVGGAGGAGKVGPTKRSGELVLRVLKALTNARAWPDQLLVTRGYEERALKLHLAVLKDVTLLRASVRELCSLVRTRLSEVVSSRTKYDDLPGKPEISGNGWGVWRVHRARSRGNRGKDGEAQSRKEKSHSTQEVHHEINAEHSSGSQDSVWKGGGQGDCRARASAQSKVAAVSKALRRACDAVEHESMRDAEEALNRVCSVLQVAAVCLYLADKETRGAEEDSGWQSIQARDDLARTIVKSCLDIHVAHLRRCTRIGTGEKRRRQEVEEGGGILIWLLPMAEMLGGSLDVCDKDAGRDREALVWVGDSVKDEVEKLLCERMHLLVSVHISALSALALALGNGLVRLEGMDWLGRVLLRLLAQGRAHIVARDGLPESRSGRCGCEMEGSAVGVVEVCMALVMAAISIEKPIYLWDAETQSESSHRQGLSWCWNSCGSFPLGGDIGAQARSWRGRGGCVLLPRLVLHLLVCVEPNGSSGADIMQGGCRRSGGEWLSSASAGVEDDTGSCEAFRHQEAFWQMWASGDLLALRRAAGCLPLKTLVLAVASGLTARAHTNSMFTLSGLKLALAASVQRELGGCSEGVATGDGLLVRAYAEVFSALSLAARLRCAHARENGRGHGMCVQHGNEGGRGWGCGMWGEGSHGVKDLLLVLLIDDWAVLGAGQIDGCRGHGERGEVGKDVLRQLVAFADSHEERRERVIQACHILDLLPHARLLKLLNLDRKPDGNSNSKAKTLVWRAGHGVRQEIARERGRVVGRWVQECLYPYFVQSGAQGIRDAHASRPQESSSYPPGHRNPLATSSSARPCYPPAVGALVWRLVRAVWQDLECVPPPLQGCQGHEEEQGRRCHLGMGACEPDTRDLGVDAREEDEHASRRLGGGEGNVQTPGWRGAGGGVCAGGGCVGRGLMDGGEYAIECLLLHIPQNACSLERTLLEEDKVLSAACAARRITSGLTLAEPLLAEVRSTIVVLLREDEDKDDVARTLLARALLLQAFAPQDSRRSVASSSRAPGAASWTGGGACTASHACKQARQQQQQKQKQGAAWLARSVALLAKEERFIRDRARDSREGRELSLLREKLRREDASPAEQAAALDALVSESKERECRFEGFCTIVERERATLDSRHGCGANA